MKAATISARTPNRRCVSRRRIVSRSAPTVQKRLRWARKPINNPTASAINSGACWLPGPVVEKKIGPTRLPSASRPNSGATTKSTSRIITNTGIIQPAAAAVGRLRPRLKPRLRKTMPSPIPTIKPIIPGIAFQSPPLSRRKARQGQPRKTSAPIMANMPSKKRTSGEEPPRGLNSRKMSAAIKEPNTKPMISGRIY